MKDNKVMPDWEKEMWGEVDKHDKQRNTPPEEAREQVEDQIDREWREYLEVGGVHSYKDWLEELAISERSKNIELINALAECCRMFEWCDVRYGQLIRSPSPS